MESEQIRHYPRAKCRFAPDRPGYEKGTVVWLKSRGKIPVTTVQVGTRRLYLKDLKAALGFVCGGQEP